MRHKWAMAAKVLSGILVAAMIINSTQTACASSQADFDVDIEEIILLEEEASENDDNAFLEETEELDDYVDDENSFEETEEVIIEEAEDESTELTEQEPLIIEVDDIIEKLCEEELDAAEEIILTEDEIEVKSALVENDVVSDLIEMEEGEDYVEDQVIAMASDNAEAELIAKAYGGELIDFSYGIATISLEESELTVLEAFEYGINPETNVPAVEPDYLLSFDENDDYAEFNDWVNQRNNGQDDPLLNPGSGSYQWHLETLGCYDAWDVSLGSSDITVAVIDSGVQTNHQDLKDAIVDDYEQLNKDTAAIGLNDNNDDGFGHGTHVAGLVAASSGNGIGGAGIAPGAKIMPINVCDPQKPSTPIVSYMIKAILYVAGAIDGDNSTYYTERRADIINMSIGSNAYNAAMKAAVDVAYAQGVTIVAAMGNDGGNMIKYPARYDHVIGVCATRTDNTLASFSNYGEWADISAPGAGIYSSTMGAGNSYGSKDGTSMASPIVAGACALYMSYVGHVEPDVMESVLKSSATPISQTGAGAGVVNVARMLGLDPEGVLPYYTMGLVDTLTLDKTSVTLSSAATALSDTEQLNIHDLEYKKYNGEAYGNADHTFFEWTSSNTKVADFNGQSKGYGVTGVTIASVSPGTATITCKALDGSGKKATCKIKVVGDKAIKEVSLLCDRESSYVTEVNGKVKSVVLFNGAPSRTDEIGEEEILIEDDHQYSDVILIASQSTKSGTADDGIRAPVFKNSNPKVVRIDRIDSSGKVIKLTALSKGSANITCTTSDGSGKSTTIKVKVQQLATGIEVSGQAYVTAGTKATYKAHVFPDNANNKKVNWKVGEYDGSTLKPISGITINKNGVVSVANYVTYRGAIFVRAISVEDDSVEGWATFTLGARADRIALYNPNEKSGEDWTTMGVGDVGVYKSSLTLVGVAFSPDSVIGKEVTFASSNPSVVSVYSVNYDSNTGKTTAALRANKKGKATITCKASDGSNKSKKVSLKVITPVSGLSLNTKDNLGSNIAYGATVQVTGTVGKVFGKPNNSKIIWNYDIVAYKQSSGYDRLSEVNPDLLKKIKKNGSFFSVSKGKIKVNSKEKFEKNIEKYGYDGGTKKYKDFGVIITASTADGSGFKKESSIFRAVEPATKMDFYRYIGTKSGKTINYTLSDEKIDILEIDLADECCSPTIVHIDHDSGVIGSAKNPVLITCSNTSVASGYYGTHTSSQKTGLIIYPYKVGEVSFTVTLRDGSGFTKVLKIEVKDSSKE